LSLYFLSLLSFYLCLSVTVSLYLAPSLSSFLSLFLSQSVFSLALF
jgi:hypothetical protein